MRPVTADHILFDEAIAAFRPAEAAAGPPLGLGHESQTGYVLLDFQVPTTVDCGDFQLQPTRRVDLAGGYAAFIAPLIPPAAIDCLSSLPFTVAVSTVISFAVGHPAKTKRDRLFGVEEISPEKDVLLALHFPVLIAGPGAHMWHLSPQQFGQYEQSIKAVAALLRSLPYKEYVRFMRAMRLVQLAHNSVRDDFALAYYLVVSAIEVIATRAVRRKEVVERHPQEIEWERAATTNSTIKDLLSAYKQARGNDKYLTKRFVAFVLRYCPPSQWAELDHPLAWLKSFYEEHGHTLSFVTKRSRFEVYPDDLPEPLVGKVLRNLYQYRSNFTHEGVAPPHRNPVSYNRYFDRESEYDEETGKVRTLLLPNFRLVSFIAQRAILNYGKELLSRSS